MTTPMTVEGEAALREELERLKKVERPRITAAIAEARAHGDLKENSEYHAARDEQGLAEARVRAIEAKLSDSQVIDVTAIAPSGRVIFGTTITLLDMAADTERRLKIVGEDEADIRVGKISVMSPLARSLIGKEEGEVVMVQTPGGSTEYEIQTIEHL